MARAKLVQFPQVAGADNFPAVNVPLINVIANGTLAVPQMDVHIMISKTSAIALTLPLPTQADNGTEIQFITTTAFAHVLTVDGPGSNNGFNGSTNNTLTFTGVVDNGVCLVAFNLFWWIIPGSNVNGTLSHV